MLSYELCKRLKEVGYTLKKLPPDGDDEKEEVYGIDGFYYFIPTLSELIEACGNDFKSLEIRDKWVGSKWEAKSVPIGVLHSLGLIAETPEEAVAHLYLKLKILKNNE